MSFPSKPISYAKAMPSNYRKTLRHSCRGFLCDQHILRRVLQCCFWMLQSQESPGDPQHLLPQLGSTSSFSMRQPLTCSSLWDPSGSVPCCSHSTLHQEPHSGSSSVEYGQIGSDSAHSSTQTQRCSHVDQPPG